MAEKQGRLNRIGVSTDGGSIYNNLESLVDATYNLDKSEIDVSDRGDLDWSSFLTGRKSGSIDLSARWDVADTELMALLTAWDADTKLDFRWQPDTVAGEKEFTSKGYVMAFTPASPGEDATNVSITIRITGAVTQTTQT